MRSIQKASLVLFASLIWAGCTETVSLELETTGRLIGYEVVNQSQDAITYKEAKFSLSGELMLHSFQKASNGDLQRISTPSSHMITDVIGVTKKGRSFLALIRNSYDPQSVTLKEEITIEEDLASPVPTLFPTRTDSNTSYGMLLPNANSWETLLSGATVTLNFTEAAVKSEVEKMKNEFFAEFLKWQKTVAKDFKVGEIKTDLFESKGLPFLLVNKKSVFRLGPTVKGILSFDISK